MLGVGVGGGWWEVGRQIGHVGEADLAEGDQGGPDFVFDEGAAVVFEEDVAAEVGEVDWAGFGVGHAGVDERGEEVRCEEIPQLLWVEWTAFHCVDWGFVYLCVCGGFGCERLVAWCVS